MKHTLYAVLAASIAMLATSGIVALATAAPSSEPEEMVFTADETADAEFEAYLSDLIEAQYQLAKKAME